MIKHKHEKQQQKQFRVFTMSDIYTVHHDVVAILRCRAALLEMFM